MPIDTFDDDERQASVRETARRAILAGLRVIPPMEDGTKRPQSEKIDGEWTWKHWATVAPSREQLRAWWGPRTGVGIITGAPSGNVELFEFEDRDTYQVFRDTAEACGLGDLVERIETGYMEATPGGGIHWLWRCDEIGGNEKLARHQIINPETGKTEIHPLIETRGEGGFAVIAPTWGRVHATGRPYELLRGGVESIVTVTPEERRELFRVARALDELPEEPIRTPRDSARNTGGKPGDDFNARATWEQVLEPHGWRVVRRRGQVTHWRRPDKDVGISATTNWAGSGLLWVFSTSTPFEAEQGYSKWRAFAILEHAGDFKAAAQALAQAGYGEPRKHPSIRLVAANDAAPAEGATTPAVPVFPITDTGNAERLVRRHGKDLRYCHLWSKWLVWDGRRWVVDETGAAERRVKETVRAIPEEAVAVIEQLKDRKLYGELLTWAVKSEAEARQRAMLRLAQSEEQIAIGPDVLDTNPWLLTVGNGTLDLRDGALGPHRRRDLITRAVEIDYDPEAGCPAFLSFLERVTRAEDGTPRPELVTFLQRAVGYALTGATRERALFILHGTGANGKSTLIDVIRRLLGDYAMRVPTDTLMARRGESIPNDIARLKGARFVFAAETDEGRRLSEALIKDLTGGDTISARFMRGEWFDFRPEFKIWLATNHKPSIRGTDPAIWDRIRLIPFETRIPDAEQDKTLPATLESELPGILAWAVAGCLEWQQDGLGTPAAVTNATAIYRASQDVLAMWIDECCALHVSFRATAGELYASYKAWCERAGERYLPQRSFGQRLLERGFQQQKGTGGKRLWNGLSVAGESTQTGFEGSMSSGASGGADAPEMGQVELTSGMSGASGASIEGDDDDPDF